MGKNSLVETVRQKQAMIDAIEANFGNITKAAKAAGINVRTHNRWRKEDNEYDTLFMSIKDISYGKLKDSLLEEAMKRIKKGDSAVLNQMLRLFYKNLQEDMSKAAFFNNVPIRAKVKFVNTPVNWNLEEVKKAHEEMRREG